MKIYILLVIIFFVSCLPNKPDYIIGNHNVQSASYDEIRYFKDQRTNVCFAEINSGNSYSFTCVPCELLDKVNLTKDELIIKQQKIIDSLTKNNINVK